MLANKLLLGRRFFLYLGFPSLLLVSFYIFLQLAYNQGYRINFTRSMPLGVYKIHSGPEKFQRGDQVIFCLPKEILPKEVNLPKGDSCSSGALPFLKEIIAVPGDHVQVLAAGVVVNGVLINQTTCSAATGLSCMGYQQTLPEGMYWVFGSGHMRSLAKHSFDSRYFGPISIETIQGTAVKLL